MKIELKTVKSNPLLERREVSFEVENSKTPNRLEVKRELASILKMDEDKVWVRHMTTKTGTHLTIGFAHIYNDPQKALLVEPKHIIKRNKPPVEENKNEDKTEDQEG